VRRASLALALLLMCTNAFALTYTVEADGSGDFATIQAAIDNIGAGDTILLGDGTFTGPGNVDLDTNGDEFTIRSASDDPALCRIDCQGSAGNPHMGILFDGQSPASVLRGITISGGYDAVAGGALRLLDASPQIINCVFENNTAYNFGGAIYAYYSAMPLIQNCRFDGNIADYYGQGGAIFAEAGAEPTVEDCTFTSNTANDGSAIYGNLEANIVVRRSTFWNNGTKVITMGEDSQVLVENSILAFNTGSAVSCFSNGLIWVQCSDIFGNPGGNWTGCISGLDGILGNMELNPIMCNPAGGDYTLHATSPCAPANSGSCGPIGAWPVGCWTVTTVAADGSGDHPTIQAAVDAAAGDGSEIIELLDGSYVGPGNNDVDFLGKALTIRSQSGNPDACIIERGSQGQARGFVFQSGEGPGSVLEGVTIRDGKHDLGGAIFIDGAGPTLRDCLFELNVANFGGAIYASLGATDTLTITGSTFEGNLSYGPFAGAGAMRLYGGAFDISGCNFIDNSAVADQTDDGIGGAVTSFNSDGAFRDCIFVRNTSSNYAGAIYYYNTDNSLLLTNCTLSGNSAPSGSGILVEDSSIDIQNSIITFGQQGAAVLCYEIYDPASIDLSCSNVYGNAGGDWIGDIAGQQGINGNISADPQFCDAEHDDYSLTASSPCAPFSPPNQYCELVGAWPVGCDYGPAITSIADVGGDQGRRVRVNWAASSQDAWGSPYTVAEYSLWRRVDARAASGAAGSGPRGDRYPAGDWDYVASIPARAEGSYSVVCETLCDSTIVDGLCESTFFVSAETDMMPIFFDSDPGSGYSVDNLAPAVPFNFRLESATLLAWDESAEEDFDYFTVYGSYLDILDGSAVVVGHTTGTSFDVSGAPHLYYLLTAADFCGNESAEAVVTSDGVSVPGELPAAVALLPNHPNPFNPRTEIRFELPAAAKVDLSIFDITGRQVSRLLVAKTYEAGRHSLTWNGRDDSGKELASGVYFTRFRAAGESQSRKLTLLR
jgi:predicted outer membrane repeat protein